MLGLFRDEGVKFVLITLHAENQRLGELAHFFFLQARSQEGTEVAQSVFGVEVFLEERLEGDLSGATTTTHDDLRYKLIEPRRHDEKQH
jgi:hypothetical protein